MRFVLYFILSYIFLPLNATVDLISILVYFIILNEDERFSILFAFFAGLLLDLYCPISLGLNMLIFVILGQALIFLKKYFVREPLTLIFIFTIFYLIHLLIGYLINGIPLNITTLLLTIVLSLPVYFILSKICFKIWMKI